MRRTAMWRAMGLGILMGTSACAPKTQGELPRLIDAFEAETHVDLHLWGDPKEVMPPLSKRTEVAPPDPALVQLHLPVVEEVLMAYPVSVRERVVPHIWVVGKLLIAGTPFLGVAHPRERRFDLALRRGTNEAKLVRTMHHEIAHMIQGQGRFDRDRWRGISEGSYVGRKPDEAWKGRGAAFLREGFVSAYASKNIHEDFAEMAELAFVHPDRIRVLFARFPRIRAKMVYLTGYYERVAPGIVLPWYGPGWEAWVAQQRMLGRSFDPAALHIDEGASVRPGPESS